MTLHLRLKTNRATGGYARAKLSRFWNYSTNRYRYTISFYNDFQAFNHHAELRSYVLEKYNVDIGTREQFWGL